MSPRGDDRASVRATPRADAESRVHEAHHESLRLWLRLLTCAQMIERIIRARLRARFSTTLPRFDLMAQLERHPQGLRMGELSERLMVTGGNVTGITDQLVREGLVERHAVPDDRRASVVRLTARGKRHFDAMAAAHEAWIIELLGGMPTSERDRLHAALGRLKRGLRERDGELADPIPRPTRATRPRTP